jgi:hypothetical protein
MDNIDLSNNNLNHTKNDFLIISNEIIIDSTTSTANCNKRKYDDLYDECSNSSSSSKDSSKSFKLYDNQNIYLQSSGCIDLSVNNKNLTKCRECNNSDGGADGIENCRFIGWRK